MNPCRSIVAVIYMTVTPCRYFDSIDICKYRRDWMETRLKATLPTNGRTKVTVAKLTVFVPTEVEIGLFQRGSR